jgi:AraC-like DNA-binding protein
MNTKLYHITNWLELARQVNWNVKALARVCGISVSTLERYFVTSHGKSPKKWLAEQRYIQALDLLHNGASVKEAAAILGFKHPSHLTNAFKKHKGLSPTRNGRRTAIEQVTIAI